MTHYEINVAKKDGEYPNGETRYKHYFATAERSITSEDACRTTYRHFAEVFPAPEYNITVTYYPGHGTILNAEKHFGKRVDKVKN